MLRFALYEHFIIIIIIGHTLNIIISNIDLEILEGLFVTAWRLKPLQSFWVMSMFPLKLRWFVQTVRWERQNIWQHMNFDRIISEFEPLDNVETNLFSSSAILFFKHASRHIISHVITTVTSYFRILQLSPFVLNEMLIPTLRASLSDTLLQTLPDLATPVKGHSLSPRSCPGASERFRY